jgi:pepF/M3 family oligoendopeptidase
MSVVRNLAYEPARETRQAAYQAELAAWARAAVPLAAAMNGVKGEAALLASRRGWSSLLDEALFDNGIERPVLDAMMGAARERFPVFRRYLRAKARALGAEALPWYDLFAPLGESARTWEFEATRRFIEEQFGAYSDRLRELAARAFDQGWIDAEPRSGKRDGAFCMHLRGDESRVLANFKPNFAGMSTLAHELGHAYHNLNLGGRRPLQRSTPRVVAETASIFCETLVREAALREAAAGEQLAILENGLRGATQVVVDITSRFLFEQGLFERRAQRELSVDELNELMLQAQRLTYGDGLDGDLLHPYMWAAKPHYYQAHFYNFPYMFGLLFGLGMYARYVAEPESFRAHYDDLLSSTGMADVVELGQRFGIDVRDEAFWRSSLDVIGADVERFEVLVT